MFRSSCSILSVRRFAPTVASSSATPTKATMSLFPLVVGVAGSWRFCSSSSSTTSHHDEELTNDQKLQKVKAAAARANAFMAMHKSNVNLPKHRIALQAWRELQEVPESFVEEVGDLDSVVKMLHVYAYFKPIWEYGHDGPAKPLPLRTKKDQQQEQQQKKRDDPDEVEIPPDFLQTQGKMLWKESKKTPHVQQRRMVARPKPVDMVGQMIE